MKNIALSLIGVGLLIAAQSYGQQATALHNNAEHSGESIWRVAPKLPLVKKWDVALPGALSYPLIADGKVFILSGSYDTETSLYALDAADGHVLWSHKVQDQFYPAGLTYGDGRVYVLRGGSLHHDLSLVAFNGVDGTQAWSRKINDDQGSRSAPTFGDGLVFLVGAGTGKLFAVDAATGAISWIKYVDGGGYTSPAVGGGTVYVANPSNKAYAFVSRTGARIWKNLTAGSGGETRDPVLSDFGLLTRDPNLGNHLLDLNNGAVLYDFVSDTLPASSGKFRFDLVEGALQCHDQSTNELVWTYQRDSRFITPPIVVNNYVVCGLSDGTVCFVKKLVGKLAWQTNVGHILSRLDEHNLNMKAIPAAGEGLILFPAQKRLVAYGNP